MGLQKKTTNNIQIRNLVKLMPEEIWKIQYKKWKKLKPYQIRLIDDGPKSQSHEWLLNSMWCEWMDLKDRNVSKNSEKGISSWTDPWEA